MTKRSSVSTDKAPAAIGPYSQAIVAGNFVFVSGQIPIDPQTGAMPEGIEAQTHQVLKNLKAILESAGSGLEHAVKMTVFVQDINHFPIINEIYASYFGDTPPARSLVQVAKIPRNALIEIEAIALIP